MSMQEQHEQDKSKGLEMFLLFFVIVIAWPALLLGAVTRWQIKQRTTNPFPYWIGAGAVGAIGAMVLVTRENPYPFLLVVLHDLVPLFVQIGIPTLKHFLLDALPLWTRSVLVFPWLALVLELFSPKNLQATLLAQERQRRTIQTRKSRRAARRAVNAPDQINGKGVLGVLIENPNE